MMIRRTKAILDLPSKDDRLVRVPFNHEEERHYRQIEQPVMDMLDRNTGDDSQTQVPWMTAIQQINKLRLICNLGVFIPSQFDCTSQPGNLDDKTTVMNARFSMDGGSCELCSQPVETSALGSSLRDITQPQVYYSACSKFYCAECSASLQYRSPEPCACIEQPRQCQLRLLASFLATPSLTPTDSLSPSSMDWDYSNEVSSKVWALFSQIKSRPQEKQ